jgi:hypothetical protein
MQIAGRRFDVLVAHQNLNGSQVRSVFEHVRGKAVPQGVAVLLMICTPQRSAIDITRSMEQQCSWFDTYGAAVRRS